jgi:hypothetical protein
MNFMLWIIFYCINMYNDHHWWDTISINDCCIRLNLEKHICWFVILIGMLRYALVSCLTHILYAHSEWILYDNLQRHSFITLGQKHELCHGLFHHVYLYM